MRKINSIVLEISTLVALYCGFSSSGYSAPELPTEKQMILGTATACTSIDFNVSKRQDYDIEWWIKYNNKGERELIEHILNSGGNSLHSSTDVVFEWSIVGNKNSRNFKSLTKINTLYGTIYSKDGGGYQTFTISSINLDLGNYLFKGCVNGIPNQIQKLSSKIVVGHSIR